MASTAVLMPREAPIPTAPVPTDNVQELIKRKREVEMNKRRYHLTEADANLLLTNANEFSFEDGQIIGHVGDNLNSAYRVKSGIVALKRDGSKICELTQGWFIGEGVFLSSRFAELKVDLIAEGPVVLAELNTPFVQKLFEVDRTLAQKFYRHIASKLSVIYFEIIGELVLPSKAVRTFSTSSFDSFSSSSDFSTSSNSGSSSAPRPPSPHSTDSNNLHEMSTPRRKLSKRQSTHFANMPFKAYPLESARGGTKTALLKSRKIEIKAETLGLKFKKKILFSNIRNFVRTSESSVTIVSENNRAKTLFFKNPKDLEEFYGVLQSLVERVAQPASKSRGSAPLSSPKGDVPSRDEIFHTMDKEVLTSMGVVRQYRKGDVVVEEGDLLQRVHIITSGTMSAVLNGHDVHPLQTGDSFGLVTMLHLRPYPTSIVVTSETAEVVVIPMFKIQEIIDQNTDLGARIFQKAAIVVSLQVEQLIRINKERGTLVF
eukprot:Phypoly_transcript_06608.p1 GENE.Phypoly_transcript_06608~~Phypoly_transcript_06608.p1  ORF type:complete len:487 (+),score=78.82 Phypoly_transcript_06608:90-1550(+)